MTDDGAQATPGLYLVGTPIGNLEDVSRRVVRLLSQADLIAAEDTRRARALLSHLGIASKRVVALDAHAGARAIAEVVECAAQGGVVCLTTDAGMPTISDPGVAAVRHAVEQGVPVLTIPGPSAATAAAAVSGLVEQEFTFLGFLPRKGEKRRRALCRMQAGLEPIVFFESPQRMAETLEELAALIPEREACVARELTKLHEEALHGTLLSLKERNIEWRGELTVVIGADPTPIDSEEDLDWAEVDARISAALAAGASAKDLSRDLSAALGVPRRQLYSRVLELQSRTRGSD